MKNIAIKENHLYTKAYRNGKKFVGRYVVVYPVVLCSNGGLDKKGDYTTEVVFQAVF